VVGRLGVGVSVLAVALAGAACGGGGDEPGGRDKVLRFGATASITGELVWVSGGTEGTSVERDRGTMTPLTDVVAYDLDGDEVARVEVGDGGSGAGVVEGRVLDLGGGRRLLVGGTCPIIGSGCNGPTAALVAELTDDEVTPIDLGGDHEGPARPLGVVGGAAWLLVDPFDPPHVRVDAATGAATVSDLPPLAITGGVCAGPDGVVAGIADRDDSFAALGLELLRRGTGADDPWTSIGSIRFDHRRPSRVDLHCLGGGEVLASFREENGPPLLLSLADDQVAVLPAPPDGLQGGLATTLDPATGTAVVTQVLAGGPASAWAHAPGGGWDEVGTVVGELPVLGIVDGEVVDVGGAAAVAGAAPARIGRLP
jgi:hypothetical protein